MKSVKYVLFCKKLQLQTNTDDMLINQILKLIKHMLQIYLN